MSTAGSSLWAETMPVMEGNPGSAALVVTIPAAAGLVAALVWLWVVPRLAEPAGVGDEAKVPYRQFGTVAHALLVAALTVVAAAAALAGVPPRWWPAWLVLSIFGVALAVIDGYTAWMPASVTRVGWVCLALAVLAGGAITADWTGVLRAFAGGLAAGGLFGLAWLVRQAFGFGDVRYVVLLGGASATLGWDIWAIAVCAGCALCALQGIARRLRGCHTPYPWAPALLAGCLIAVIIAPHIA